MPTELPWRNIVDWMKEIFQCSTERRGDGQYYYVYIKQDGLRTENKIFTIAKASD